MSNGKSSRMLIIGVVEQGAALGGSALFQAAGELSIYDRVEWLFFYYDNMGIITGAYNNRLITGYPVPDEIAGGKPFSDSASQVLFREFFERFLFAKKIQVIITTTPIALEHILNMARKRGIRVLLFERSGALEKRYSAQTLQKVQVIPSRDNETAAAKNKIGTQPATLEEVLQEILKQLSP